MRDIRPSGEDRRGGRRRASRRLASVLSATLIVGVAACGAKPGTMAGDAAPTGRCVTPAETVLERFRLPEDWVFAETMRDGAALRWGGGGRSQEQIVLILPGLEEPIELFGEMARILTEQGAEVYAVDWRHQGRSERYGPDPERVNVDDFDVYLADLDAIAADGLDARLAAFDGEFVVAGSSMGGHLAIRWADRRDDIDKLVLISPAIQPYGAPREVWAALLALTAGFGDAYAAGQGPWSDAESLDDCAGGDFSGYEPRAAAWRHLLVRDPGLRVGGPTYNWLAAIVESSYAIDALPPGYTSAEIVVFSAERDRYVDNAAQRQFCRRQGASCALVSLDAEHSAFLERDLIFYTILQEILGRKVFRF